MRLGADVRDYRAKRKQADIRTDVGKRHGEQALRVDVPLGRAERLRVQRVDVVVVARAGRAGAHVRGLNDQMLRDVLFTPFSTRAVSAYKNGRRRPQRSGAD
jgi:hypothetical protein